MTSKPNAARKPSRKKAAKKKPTRKKPAKKRGRPRIEFDLERVRKLGALKPTDRELGTQLDVSERTIYNRKKDDPEFLQALQKGEDDAKLSLKRTLWKKALEGHPTILIWVSKNVLGWSDNPVIEDSRDHALTLLSPDGERQYIGPKPKADKDG